MSKTVKIDSEGHVSLENETVDLARKVREYAEAFELLLPLLPVSMTVDPTNPKLMAQLILENVTKKNV